MHNIWSSSWSKQCNSTRRKNINNSGGGGNIQLSELKTKGKIFEVKFDGTQKLEHNSKDHNLWHGTLKHKGHHVHIFTKDKKSKRHATLKPLFSWFKDQKKINADHFIVKLANKSDLEKLKTDFKNGQCSFATTNNTKYDCKIYAFNNTVAVTEHNYKTAEFKPILLNDTANSSNATLSEEAKKSDLFIISIKHKDKIEDFEKTEDLTKTNPLPRCVHYVKGGDDNSKICFNAWERVFYDDEVSKHMFVDISPETRRSWYENNQTQ